jgi:hypothetical protein
MSLCIEYLVVCTILYTIIGCLHSEVSLKWQLKMDENNLLKLNIGRKINLTLSRQ